MVEERPAYRQSSGGRCRRYNRKMAKYQFRTETAHPLSRVERAALLLELLREPLLLQVLTQPENQRQLRKLWKPPSNRRPQETFRKGKSSSPAMAKPNSTKQARMKPLPA